MASVGLNAVALVKPRYQVVDEKRGRQFGGASGGVHLLREGEVRYSRGGTVSPLRRPRHRLQLPIRERGKKRR